MKNDVNRNDLQIISTADGSYTLHSEQFGEHYHSLHGAATESRHVYISNGLAGLEQEQITVLEMGFGTGLNALLTRIYGKEHHKTIRYITWEMYPVDPAMLPVPDAGYAADETATYWQEIHQTDWEQEHFIDPLFSLLKIRGDISDVDMVEAADIIYYDAFSIKTQPELWDVPHMRAMFNALKPGGKLVTYSCSGPVKRALREVGFLVKRLPGPPGKYQMLNARKPVV